MPESAPATTRRPPSTALLVPAGEPVALGADLGDGGVRDVIAACEAQHLSGRGCRQPAGRRRRRSSRACPSASGSRWRSRTRPPRRPQAAGDLDVDAGVDGCGHCRAPRCNVSCHQDKRRNAAGHMLCIEILARTIGRRRHRRAAHRAARPRSAGQTGHRPGDPPGRDLPAGLRRRSRRWGSGRASTASWPPSGAGVPYRLTPTELARHRMMTSGGMTALLDRVERKGFVARSPNPADRRQLPGRPHRRRPSGDRRGDGRPCRRRAPAGGRPAGLDRQRLADLLRTLLLSVDPR